MTPSGPDQLVTEWQQLVNCETALLGLLHWHEQTAKEWERGPLNSPRAIWYYGAFIQHADAIFNSKRPGYTQHGAVIRALQELGYPEFVAMLEEALAGPASENGSSLHKVITRMRNEMLVHTNLRLDEMGPAFVVMGDRSGDFADALAILLKAVTRVLDGMAEAKLVRVPALPTDSFERIQTMVARAREREQRRRNAQSQASKVDQKRNSADSEGGGG